MNVGFTGTQKGMSEAQFESFISVILALKPTEFHHGDCIGSDEEATKFVQKYISKCIVVCHPPKSGNKRAHTKFNKIRTPKEYLDRNRDIVDETEVLVATPKENKEKLRSGTWATIRYANLRGKERYIIYPDGSIVQK